MLEGIQMCVSMCMCLCVRTCKIKHENLGVCRGPQHVLTMATWEGTLDSLSDLPLNVHYIVFHKIKTQEIFINMKLNKDISLW